MNAQSLYLGKARTWIFSLTFAVSTVLLSFFVSFALESDVTCTTDSSHKGIELACDGELQYAVIDAQRDYITFDVAMPLGVNKEGTYGECEDVNTRENSRTGPACNNGNSDLYPFDLASEYASRYTDAVLVINGDLFGSIDLKHGAEGLTIVNGVRVDGGPDKYGNDDGGPVGDDDGNGYRRPSTIIRGDGQEIDIAERSLLGIQQLTESLSSTPLLEAIGGCPLLVENGVVRADIEEKTSSFCASVGVDSEVERTAIGVMPDGKLVVVVHQSATLPQLALWFKDFGVKNAINLDGGGSTQMWFKSKSEEGKMIFPSTRPVANALVISHSQEDIPETCFGGLPDIACVLFDYLPPIVTDFYTTYLGGNQVTSASMQVETSGGVVKVTAEGVTDEGGSGTNFVEFNAKWPGQDWTSIGIVRSAPFELHWDMCQAGVPDGDVEFGMIVQDYAGNRYVWSEHHPNPHVQKSFNCNPNQNNTSGAVKLHSDTYYGGIVVQSRGTGFSNEPNAEGVSLSMPDGWSVRVWSDDNKAGSEKCFSSSQHNLQDHGWNHRIQSWEVFSSNVCGDADTGVVVVCSEGRACWQFEYGYHALPYYRDNEGNDLNDALTHISAMPSNMSLSVFRSGDRKGSYECENEIRTLPEEFYREVTDIFVHRGKNCPADQHRALIFHEGRDFGGYAWSGGTESGQFNMSDIGPDNTAYAVRIPDGMSAVFYAGKDGGGENTSCWTESVGDLENWKQKISSFELATNTDCRPQEPSSLNAAPLSPESIQVWWSHSQSAEYRFKIYKWNGIDFAEIAETEQGTTSFIDNNVLCGAQYFYKVSAQRRRESYQAGFVSATTHSCPQPKAPELDATNPTSGKDNEVLTFKWKEAQFATEYRATLFDGYQELSSGFTAATSWTIRDVPPGDYVFSVVAKGRGGQKSSDTKLISINPAAPELIDVQAVGCEAMGLYWRNTSESVTSFKVYQYDQLVGTVAAEDGVEYYSFLDENMEAGPNFYGYYIRAETAAGRYSNSGLVQEILPECEAAPTAPLSPTNLRQTTISKTSFMLEWQDNSSNEDGFQLYTWDSATDWTLSQTVPANTTKVMIETTCQGGSYYKVVAFNEAGLSGESNFVNARSGPCDDDPGQCPFQEVDTVTFFEHWKCLGTASPFEVGVYPTLGGLDNTFSGVKVPLGMSVRIYDAENLVGTSRCLVSDLHDFFYTFVHFEDGRTSLSDATSSLEVFDDRTCGGTHVFDEIKIYLPIVVR